MGTTREAVIDHGGTHNLSTASFYLFQTRTGTIRPVGIKSAVEARLHLRLANIGHPSEPPKGKLGWLGFFLKNQLLLSRNGAPSLA